MSLSWRFHPNLRSTPVRIVLACIALLVLDAIVSLLLGVRALSESGRHLDAVLPALRKGDVSEVTASLERAGDRASAAEGFTTHPGFRLVALTPGFDGELRAFDALIGVARTSAQKSGALLERVTEGAAPDAALGELFYRAGAIDLERVLMLEDAVGELAVTLQELRGGLSAQRDLRSSFARDAVARAEKRLASAEEIARAGSLLARFLPPFAGANGPRRYLLAFQSPSEARGGGGLIGLYGILEATDGRLSLGRVGPIEELGPIVSPSVRAPADFAELYGPLSGLRDWRHANLSPSFPLTSRVLVRMYRQVRGERLDGVIAIDPIALGAMMEGLGSLSAPGWDTSIDKETARKVLLFDIYRRFVHRERSQNAYLGALLEEIWGRVSSPDVDLPRLVGGFSESARKQHMKLFSVVPEEQELLTDLGLAADPRTAEAPMQILYNNNNSGNKIDFFLHRKQDIEIALNEDGSALVETDVTLENDLPTSGRRAMTRSGVRTGLEPGANRMSLHLMVPREASDISYAVDGRTVRHYMGTDSGSPVAWAVVTVPPDGETEVTISYSLAAGIDLDDVDSVFEFLIWPQATARPDVYAVSVTPPAGRTFADGSSTYETSGRLKEARLIRLKFAENAP